MTVNLTSSVRNVIAGCMARKSYQWTSSQTRSLWRMLNAVFNRPDQARIKEVGVDQACAEWLIRCGASVKWQGMDHWHKDYNTLGKGSSRLNIAEIDCDEAAVMDIGFPHLEGLKHLKRIKFNHCPYLEDGAIMQLSRVKDTLEHVSIISCGDVTDQGVQSLENLHLLKTLFLRDLPEVRHRQECYDQLTKKLPQCQIEYVDLKQPEKAG